MSDEKESPASFAALRRGEDAIIERLFFESLGKTHLGPLAYFRGV